MSGTEAGKKNMAFEDLDKRDCVRNMCYGGTRGARLGVVSRQRSSLKMLLGGQAHCVKQYEGW